ncbi:MAG: LCP family protein [Halanaerobiales bacterium]
MEKENTKKENNNLKKYIAIIAALIILGVGFYLYYFYPQIIPGLASDSFDKKVNVLMMGMDDQESVGEGEINIDSLVLCQLNPDKNELKFVNIIKEDKLTTNFNSKDINSEKLQEITTIISEKANVDVDYYLSLSYKGFKNLVNNLDGLEINLNEDIKIPDLDLDLEKGANKLNGQEALNYARWYDYNKDEKDRIKRQQQIINAILNKALKDKTLLDIPELFTTTVDTYKAVNTNIEYTLITDIVEYLLNNDNLNIEYDIIGNN